MTDFQNIKARGALGDGYADDAGAFQSALDARGAWYVPAGCYRIGAPLRVKSGTHLRLEDGAVIGLGDGALRGRGDYLLSGADVRDVTIEGGVWDGNAPGNPRNPDMFARDVFQGSMFNFRKARGLTLRNMTWRDPETFYLCLCETSDFLIEDIVFDSPHLRPNQDGIHMAGFCEHGVIRRLTGRNGSPNDDLIAINADDCHTRIGNQETVNGPIRDLTVEDVAVERCHTFVRIASIRSEVSDIRIRNLRGQVAAWGIKLKILTFILTFPKKTAIIILPRDNVSLTSVIRRMRVRIEIGRIWSLDKQTSKSLRLLIPHQFSLWDQESGLLVDCSCPPCCFIALHHITNRYSIGLVLMRVKR